MASLAEVVELSVILGGETDGEKKMPAKIDHGGLSLVIKLPRAITEVPWY